jgi:hypothetical protein
MIYDPHQYSGTDRKTVQKRSIWKNNSADVGGNNEGMIATYQFIIAYICSRAAELAGSVTS